MTESVLRRWDEARVDCALMPGFTTPAQPSGFPIFLMGIHSMWVYNMFNFPAGCVRVRKQSQICFNVFLSRYVLFLFFLGNVLCSFEHNRSFPLAKRFLRTYKEGAARIE